MANPAKALNALGDPTRRMIFEKLRNRPMAVVEIAKGLPVSRPAVSQHLKVLREAKLIHIESSGTKNLCQINPDGIEAIHHYLDKFWDRALSAFQRAAEAEAKKRKS